MLSAPSSINSYISNHVIMTSAASLCQIQSLSITHTVTSLLLHLVFSWSLLVPTPSPLVFNLHQFLQSLICYPQSQLSNTSLQPWCDSLIMSLYVSLLSLPLPVFRNVDTSKSKTAPLSQKVLSYSFFFPTTVLSQLL